MGLVFAAGVEAPIGGAKVSAELRHTAGRHNIAQGYEPLTTYNRAWSVLFATGFSIRK